MKVLIISDIDNAHTQKWVTSLHEAGVQLAVFSLSSTSCVFPSEIEIHTLAFQKSFTMQNDKGLSKLAYLKALPKLKQLIQSFQPDLLHAHYASSYGLLGALSGFQPFVISVWGSDVFQFPRKSVFHKKIFTYNLSKAKSICATSWAMTNELAKYTNKKVHTIPFGIDTSHFKWLPQTRRKEESIVIGTVKALAPIYGIDTLIKAFALLVKHQPEKDVALRIVGKGSQLSYLQQLAEQLHVSDKVSFLGYVPQAKLPQVLNEFDVFVALSLEESFGVAIIEASACELPVITSNVGGLPEVVKEGETGFMVPPNDATQAFERLQKLINDDALRKEMGVKGRAFVRQQYEWKKNVQQMMVLYQQLINEV